MGTIGLTEERMALADLALARSALYRALSQALVYPTAEAVRQLREQDIPFARAASGPLEDGVRSALEELRVAFRRVRRGRLEASYRDAFTHVHSSDCPPYETDYTTGEIFRQSQELADLAGFYRAFGVGGSSEERERPDHISVELEFLHLLAYKEAWAVVQGDGEGQEVCRHAEERFLADHVLRWVPGFARRLEAVATHQAYRAVARLTAAFVRSEARRFGLPVDAGPEPRVEADGDEVGGLGLCEGDP